MLSTFSPEINANQKVQKGFTLLELLIVLAILAILAVVLIIVLNPAETLRRSRDAQRLSDLSSMKTALGIFVTSATMTSLTDLDTASTTGCFNDTTTTAVISYSSVVPTTFPTCATNLTPGADATLGATPDFSTTASCRGLVTDAAATVTDGTGWVPVNLGSIAGGSPIASLPLDPTNTVIGATPTNADFTYRYGCQNARTGSFPSYVFEFDAVLESQAYTVTDKKMETDGGDNTAYFEIGSSVKLLPTTSNF